LLVSLPYSLNLNEILQNLPLRQGLASFYTVFSPHGSVKIEPNASPRIQQCMSIVVQPFSCQADLKTLMEMNVPLKERWLEKG
jgi:hypothetical protein